MSFYSFAQNIVSVFIRLWFRIKVKGLENFECVKGRCVLIANHKSYLDPIFVALFLKKRLFFMAKKELFSVPIFKKVIENLGAFPVDRNKRDFCAVEKAVEIVKRGDIVAMFPQGRRCKTIDEVDPKTGFLRISLKSDAYVVPCSVYYRSYLPFSRVRICYGKAIRVKSLLKEGSNLEDVEFKVVRELTKNIWQDVLKLYYICENDFER